MAKFPIQYSETIPKEVSGSFGSSGGVELAEAQARQGAAIAEFGGRLVNFALQIQKQEDAAEYSAAKRQIDEAYFAGFNSIIGDDPQTPDDMLGPKDEERWQKVGETIEQYKSNRMFSNVNNMLEEYKNEVTPEWRNNYIKRALSIRRSNVKDKFNLESENLLASGNLEGYYKMLNTRLALQDITQAEFDFKVANAKNDSILAQANKMALEGNYKGADEKLQELKNPDSDQLQYKNKIKSLAKKQKEENSSEANKQLTDLLGQQKLTISEVQLRRDILTDDDYESWTKIALQPVDKKGNAIKEAELKSRAIDVWRGTISRLELEKEMRISFAEPNGINDDQFAAVLADLDRETKGFQAQDKKAYSVIATQQILGRDSSVIQFDAMGNMTFDLAKMFSPEQEFNRKLHFVTLYNKAVDDFIAENPKVSKKDLWLKAEELKQTYTDAANAGKEMESALPTPEELRRQNTKEAYDKGVELGYWK
jgi:hypothetical protein